jgi:polyisoprenoid-binding protein YceI
MSDLQQGTWVLDPTHTSITAVAKHMMFTKVRGRFTDFEGYVEIGETPAESSVEVTIRAASIDSGVAGRDEHLRSPDFLDAGTYPELTFRSTKVEEVDDEKLRVQGDLTIRGITKPVSLDVEFEGTGVDPWGGTRAIFSASTEIQREEWGMNWNQALEAGGVLVSKTLKIEIEAQAVQPQEAAA